MAKVKKRASQKAFHFVYKTTCTETGKWYIGLHSTDKMNDGYLGSGMRLTRSVKKYGESAHNREILFMGTTRKEASDKEAELLSEEVRKDPMCMNLGPGGIGATDRPATSLETSVRLSEASKKYVRTKEWYDKVVATRKANGTYSVSEETRIKMSKSATGNRHSEESIRRVAEKNKGKKRTKEQCENISKALIGKTKGISKVFSEQHKEAIRNARIGLKHSEEAKANMRGERKKGINSKRCTVDGINIFNSVGALAAALGKGKNGTRSPNLQFIKD